MFQPIQNYLAVSEMNSNVSFYFFRIETIANWTQTERGRERKKSRGFVANKSENDDPKFAEAN